MAKTDGGCTSSLIRRKEVFVSLVVTSFYSLRKVDVSNDFSNFTAYSLYLFAFL